MSLCLHIILMQQKTQKQRRSISITIVHSKQAELWFSTCYVRMHLHKPPHPRCWIMSTYFWFVRTLLTVWEALFLDCIVHATYIGHCRIPPRHFLHRKSRRHNNHHHSRRKQGIFCRRASKLRQTLSWWKLRQTLYWWKLQLVQVLGLLYSNSSSVVKSYLAPGITNLRKFLMPPLSLLTHPKALKWIQYHANCCHRNQTFPSSKSFVHAESNSRSDSDQVNMELRRWLEPQ